MMKLQKIVFCLLVVSQASALFAAATEVRVEVRCPKATAINQFLTYPGGIQNALETIDLLIVSNYEQNPTPELKKYWHKRIQHAHDCIRKKCSELIRMPSSPKECDTVTDDISRFIRHIAIQNNLMHLIEEIREMIVFRKNYNEIRSSARCDIQTDEGLITYYKNNQQIIKRLSALSHIRNELTQNIINMCRSLDSEVGLVADAITEELRLLIPQIIAWGQCIANGTMQVEAELTKDLRVSLPFKLLAGAILSALPDDDGVNPFE